MDKRGLSERDICTKFITPAIERCGWDVQTQIRENVHLTSGRVMVRGKLVARGEKKFADYVLHWKPNVPIAVVEAKDNNHSVGDGMQQALKYSEMLDVPFVFTSNGDGFLFHDRTGHANPVERELTLEQFPSPADLWARYCRWKHIDAAQHPVIQQDYYSDGSGKAPRYYQVTAVNRVVEAVAKGQNRVLLVMATGTGKTFTAFQIIWRLWKAGVKKRVLFLADRDVLLTQTKNNDFAPFGKAMTRITNRVADPAFEVYLALYQAITSTEPEKDLFRQFSPGFFDLIIVDECHRGSASDNSAWRDVLTYFSGATQVGLTATPKETADISTSNYFGDPVFTYSLKQGIEDGFLAPYKVVRIDLDKDLQGWRPEKGKKDKFGEEIEDRVFNQSDMDRNLVLEQRTQLVAKKVTDFLKGTNRYDKTIVFCEDIDHAERMRQALVNENADLCAQNRKYVMKITGDDKEGKAELDNFIHPEERYPVVVTTSKLLSTGVDARTCKVIVLDQTIKSMTEFKQIIGRGTRIEEDHGKLFFTIIDFKKATELFADPDFDGLPVQVYQPTEGEPVQPPDEPESPEDAAVFDSEPLPLPAVEEGEGTRRKYVVADVPVQVVAERVQYYGPNGQLITESLRDFTRKAVLKKYGSLDSFLKTWSKADQKRVVVEELQNEGVFLEALADEVGKDFSPFDLVCHVAFDQPPLTRKERANKVRKRNYFTKYGEACRAVLEGLLSKFEAEGVDDIEDINVLKVQPLAQLGTPVELVSRFGGKTPYQQAVRELEHELYNGHEPKRNQG